MNTKKFPKIYLKPAVESPPEPPKYSTVGSTGADIRSAEDVVLWPGDVKAVSTGYLIEIEEGYEVQIRPRSGLALNNCVTVLNAPGSVDNDYRGLIKVILVNHSNDMPFYIRKGDRIAQLVVAPVVQADFEVVEELSQTIRGESGFGSTGVV